MADTYTTRNRLRKQATNANKNTWGALLNTDVIDMVDQALDGVTTLAMTGDVVLSSANGASDQSRARVLNVTSTGGVARTITVPPAEKTYLVRNAGTSLVLVKAPTGTGVVVLQGQSAWIFCDGSECYRSTVSGWGLLSTTNLTSGTSSTISVDVTGQKFNKLKVRLRSLTAGATPTFSFTITGTPGTTTSITLLATAGSEVTGGFQIDGYAHDGGIGSHACYASTTNPNLSAGTNGNFSWQMAGGITSFTLASTNAFTAGTAQVYLG